MGIGQDILDFLFANKALKKAASQGEPASTKPKQIVNENGEVVTLAQDDSYIRAAAAEAAKRQLERQKKADKLTKPTGKEALKVLGTK